MFGSSKHKNETIGAENVLSSSEEEGEQGGFPTKLSIPESWKMTDEEKYVFAFHNQQAPDLKENQISIYGMELDQHSDGSLEVTGLIRSTVSKTVVFKDTVILLMDHDQNVIAKKTFDLGLLGNIPPNSSRPWTFSFTAEDIYKDTEIPADDWTLAFEIKRKHELDLEDSWEKSIADQTRADLEHIVENAPELKPGEVNFLGIKARFNDNEDLAVTILIRNGADKNINLEQIPLGITDANDEEIARGSFKLDDFVVKANTSKPWTFIFPSSMVKTKEPDLSRWKAYAIQ